MSLGLAAHIARTVKGFTQPLWGWRQGLLRARRLSLPRAAGWYNLYRGGSQETVDFNAPVGQAAAGAAAIAEFSNLHPTGTGTYVYCVRGVGPGGHETEAHDTAFYEVDYESGVRTAPAPGPVVSFAAQPHVGGAAMLTVVVDHSLGRVPTASLRVCYGDGEVPDICNLLPVPVPSGSGRHVVRFVVTPALPGQPPGPNDIRVSWRIQPRSAEGVLGEASAIVFVELDSEGPPALSDFVVECQNSDS